MKHPKLAKRAMDVISRVHCPTPEEQKHACRFDDDTVEEAELDLLYAHLDGMDPETERRARKTIQAVISGERRFAA